LLTSAILLPAMIVVYRQIISWVKGEGNWQDYDNVATLSESTMDAELTG
jgi:hypothetical protein